MLAQLIVSGLGVGSIYALVGLSLVLINKATGIVNFAQAEMAMLSTFLSFTLLTKLHLPLAAVVALSIPLGMALGAAVERVFIQPIADAPPVNQLITTVGLWIVFNNLAGWIWGYDPYRFPSLFPDQPWDVAGARVSPGSVGVFAIAALAMAALYVFFEHTREGTAMRAASMNRRAAGLMGIKVKRVWLLAWMVAGGISGLAGVLIAPITFLDYEMMVPVLLKAFAGAILGGFDSLPGAAAGGFAIGVIETVFGAFVSTAFKDNFAFVVIILVLMIRPTGLFGRTQAKKV